VIIDRLAKREYNEECEEVDDQEPLSQPESSNSIPTLTDAPSVRPEALSRLKYKCVLPLFVDSVAAWEVLSLKHSMCLSDSGVNQIWKTFVDEWEPNGSRKVRELEDMYLETVGWADAEKTTRSLLGHVHALFSIPPIERKLFEGPEADSSGIQSEPEVVHSYSDSKESLAWNAKAQQMHNSHPERRNNKMYALTYAIYADKYSWSKKQSGWSILIDILNGAQGLRNLQFYRFNIAESDGTVYGSKLSLLSILRALHSEASIAYNGVEVWCEAEQETVWVYLKLGAIVADSQERCWFTSTNPPSGNSDHCCPMCDASLEQFSRGELGKPRDFVASRNAVNEAAEVMRVGGERCKEQAKAILDRVFLHWSALFNPLFFLPGVDNIFALAAPDYLHLVLFYFKVLAEQLVKELPHTWQRDLLGQRIRAVNTHLPSALHLASLESRKNWIGREARNFGLLVPYLLRDMNVDKSVVKLWSKIATPFTLLYSQERTKDLAEAVRAVAHDVQLAVLEHYPRKTIEGGQKLRRSQLNIHSPLNIVDVMLQHGPTVIWDTERAENTQSKIATFSRLTSVNMEAYTLRCAAAWQTACLARVQNMPDSIEALTIRWRASDKPRRVVPRGGNPYIVFYRIPLKVGTVICTLPADGERSRFSPHPTKCSDFKSGFYSYYIIKEVSAEGISATKLLEPPHYRSFPMQPFPLQESQEEPIILAFHQIHRAVAVLPAFAENTAEFTSSFLVVPTRFITDDQPLPREFQ
jgi:hypothetical protein